MASENVALGGEVAGGCATLLLEPRNENYLRLELWLGGQVKSSEMVESFVGGETMLVEWISLQTSSSSDSSSPASPHFPLEKLHCTPKRCLQPLNCTIVESSCLVSSIHSTLLMDTNCTFPLIEAAH